ncbi:MAG TPA: hypothetical protein VLX61_07045 [Anaerolineales bacterium]|nr:hypothetical protein [Anaerolineales bacterium]
MRRIPRKSHSGPIWLASALLILASLACSSLQAPTPTAVPTNTATSTPIPTATVRPTDTLWPTATPDVAATQRALDLRARIQGYVQNGYLDSDKGSFFKLQDATFDMAKMDCLNFKDAGYEDEAQGFAAWAEVKLSSASAVNYPEYSSCGFTFRLNDQGDAYTAMCQG